jgi:hypothetical protein
LRSPAGGVSQLAGHPLHVGDEAAVDSRARGPLAVALEDVAEHEELGGDLGRREAEALPLPREVRGRLRGVVVLLERRDERREGAELAQPPEPLQRGHGAGSERFLHALDGEIPRGQPHDPVHAVQSREGVG